MEDEDQAELIVRLGHQQEDPAWRSQPEPGDQAKSIRAAYLMLVADEHRAEEELQKLNDIADALGISETDLKAITAATKPASN
jgi:hypothetical protein